MDMAQKIIKRPFSLLELLLALICFSVLVSSCSKNFRYVVSSFFQENKIGLKEQEYSKYILIQSYLQGMFPFRQKKIFYFDDQSLCFSCHPPIGKNFKENILVLVSLEVENQCFYLKTSSLMTTEQDPLIQKIELFQGVKQVDFSAILVEETVEEIFIWPLEVCKYPSLTKVKITFLDGKILDWVFTMDKQPIFITQ